MTQVPADRDTVTLIIDHVDSKTQILIQGGFVKGRCFDLNATHSLQGACQCGQQWHSLVYFRMPGGSTLDGKTLDGGICKLGNRCKRTPLWFGQVFDQRNYLVTQQAWHQPLQLTIIERVQPLQWYFQRDTIGCITRIELIVQRDTEHSDLQ